MLLAPRRPGTAADAVNGIVPAFVVEPDTPEALAAILVEASRERLQTVIRGGGTKIGWGRPAPTVDLVVSTASLNRLIAHRHGDLTVTVQAGMTLRELNRQLRRERQWLPLESAFEGSTLGGLVSTNEAGPSRHRNGTPRDLVIGITLALTDGRLVKAGGTVVKNVAGYDLGKLVSGAHGSFAAIADVTFKLVPMPRASTTIIARYADASALTRDVAALAASQLEPAAFDVRADLGAAAQPLSVLVRFASSPAATDAQVAQARSMMSVAADVITGEPEFDLWMSNIQSPWTNHAAVVRFSWLPTRLPQVLSLVADVGRPASTFVGRALGVGLLGMDGDAAAQVAAIERLRGSADIGHVVVLRAAPDVAAVVDAWGPPRDTDGALRALKQMFDPAGILNAGRGVV
jgi:glycolate oxidase FAD binding subunit